MSLSKRVMAVSTAIAIAASAAVPVSAQDGYVDPNLYESVADVGGDQELGVSPLTNTVIEPVQPLNPAEGEEWLGGAGSWGNKGGLTNRINNLGVGTVRCVADNGDVRIVDVPEDVSLVTGGVTITPDDVDQEFVFQQLKISATSKYDAENAVLRAEIEQGDEYETEIPFFLQKVTYFQYDSGDFNSYETWDALNDAENIDVSWEREGKTLFVEVAIKNFAAEDIVTVTGLSPEYNLLASAYPHGFKSDFDADFPETNEFGRPCSTIPVTETVTAPAETVTATMTETPVPVTQTQTAEPTTITETAPNGTVTVTVVPEPVTETVVEREPADPFDVDEPEAGSADGVLDRCVANATASPLLYLAPIAAIVGLSSQLATPYMGAFAELNKNAFGGSSVANDVQREIAGVFGVDPFAEQRNEFARIVNQVTSGLNTGVALPAVDSNVTTVIGVVAVVAALAGVGAYWCTTEEGETIGAKLTGGGSSTKDDADASSAAGSSDSSVATEVPTTAVGTE